MRRIADVESDASMVRVSRRGAAMLRLALDYTSVLFVVAKSLVLVPLYLRTCGVTLYGAWLASGNVLSLIGLLEGGFVLVYSQRLGVRHGKGDAAGFAREAGVGGTVLLVAAIGIGVASLALSAFVPDWVQAPSGERHSLSVAFVLAGFGLTCTLLQSMFGALYNAWQNPRPTGVLRIAGQVLELLLVVAGLRAGWGVIALGGAAAMSGLAGLVVIIGISARDWASRRLPRPSASVREARDFLAETAPVFLSRLGSVLLNNNEPLIATLVIGPEAAVVIGLTDRVFKMCQMVLNQVAAAAYFGLAHLRGEHADGEKVSQVTLEVVKLASALTAVVFAIALVFNPSFMALWLTDFRFGGHLLNVFLTLAAMMAVRANLFGVVLGALGANAYSAWCQLAELVIRVPLIIILMRMLGLAGLPLAVIVSSGSVAMPLYAVLLRRKLRIVSRDSVILAGVLPIIVCVGAAIPISFMLPALTTWGRFIGVVAPASVVCLMIAIGVDPFVRQYVVSISVPLLRRFGAAIGSEGSR